MMRSSSLLTRRDLLKHTGTAAAIPLVGGLPRVARAGGTTWNVVVICLDEVCYRDMALLDLPNLKRLASEGVSCTAAYCASPVCAPTRASFLTGLYPSEHGVIANQYVLNEGVRTVVDVFKDAGYTTAVYGKLHTNNSAEVAGAGFGFQSIWNTGSADFSSVKGSYRESSFTSFYDTDDTAIFDAIKASTGKQFGAAVVHVSKHDDYVVTQEALAFLDVVAEDSDPFFLYVSLLAPHLPLKAPMQSADLSTDDWYYRWTPEDVASLSRLAGGRTDSPGWRLQNDTYNDWSAIGADATHLLMARYMGYLEYADYLVGLVLDRLDALGLDENTVVVFMSDHGDQNGHRGLFLKETCFLESVQTPLIYRMPGSLTAGATYEGLVSAVDILPTLAGLVGLGAELSDISGLDLSEALLGTAGATEREVAYVANHYTTSALKGGMTGIIDVDGYMSVYYNGKYVSKGYVSEASYGEVYDLAADPGQEDNLVSDSSVSALRSAHTALRKAYYADMRPLEYALAKV